MAGEEFDLEKPSREITRGILNAVKEWLSDWFRGTKNPTTQKSEGHRGILILGPGGTGKTTLARLLSGQMDWLDDVPGRYRESPGLEVFALRDDPDIEVVVAPGQEYRRRSTWPELLAQLAAGEFRGVILMNAFGYHTFSTPSYKSHQLFTGSKPDFLKAFVEDRRQDEVRVLKQVAPQISACPHKIWFLTMVAKQDLWGSQQKAVEDYYERGPYAETVLPIFKALGDRTFRHDVVYLSLILRSLETLAGERLQENEAGYDMPRWSQSIRHLIDVFAALRDWEANS